MRTVKTISLLCISMLVVAWPAAGKDKSPKGRAGKQPASGGAVVVHARTQPVVETKAAPGGKEPWLDVKVAFSDDERRVVLTYVDQCSSGHVQGRKGKPLPPGLAKKVARGGELPPGWQKKCIRGEVMPVAVYERCHPLPPEVVVKLAPPPPGTITVTIGGKVVRLVKATREILDVFDVHVRL